MATTVSMPQLGETVTEGTILRWAKQVGDSIASDEVLVEISTDKVDTEVPSPAAGTVLEILVPEGETVAVGTPLVVIGEAGEQAGAAPAEEAPAAEAAQEAPAETTEEEPAREETAPAETADGGRQTEAATAEAAVAETADGGRQTAATAAPEEASAVTEEVPAEEPGAEVSETAEKPAPEPEESPAEPEAAPAGPAPSTEGDGDGARRVLSPVVRRLAREHGLDLSGVAGTGQGGRITRQDVEALLASGGGAAAAPVEAPAKPAVPAAPPVPATAATPSAPSAPAEVPAGPGDRVVELDRLRARIGENMIRAKQTAAHVWTSVEVDFEAVERIRQGHREAFKQREGFSLTYLPFIARATIDALRAFPGVNSAFYLEQKKAVFHERIHLGIAIDLDQKGLIVATIRGADELRLVAIARRIRELADRARSGKLEPDDVTGSTFTITNPGPYGSFMSAPVINVPNVGILSTDTVSKRAVVITDDDGNDAIGIRHIGYLGLSWDHRAFDGSTAVLFLKRIEENLETWDWEQELA